VAQTPVPASGLYLMTFALDFVEITFCLPAEYA